MSYKIYTDGSCSGNPGDGGFGFVIVSPSKEVLEKYASGIQKDTTNNAEELKAFICGYYYFRHKMQPNFMNVRDTNDYIDFYTDSAYLYRGFNEWLDRWANNGFYTAKHTPIKNQGLWSRIYQIKNRYDKIRVHWLRGHNENEYNELADTLAKSRDEVSREQCRFIKDALFGW